MRAIARASLSLLFAAATAAAAPSITGIFNAASYVPSGMPNGDIAQGSIFIVKGSGLGPATLQQVSSYPLPTTQGLAGTSIQVTIGSQPFDCIMVYTSDAQVAAILPSRTAIGTGTLALLYQGQRTTFAIKVVQASFGMFAINQDGSGPGVVTDANYQYKIPTNPAHPGDTLIGWGTGLGGVSGDETRPPAQADLNTGVEVFVGNKPATVTYGGRGSSPGLDQINFVVPPGVTGCYVSLVIRVRSVISNFTSLPVAPAGESVCSDPLGTFAAGDVQKFQANGALRTATISLFRLTGTQDTANANFEKFDFLRLIGSRGTPSPGSCFVLEKALDANSPDFLPDPVAVPGLDAGAQLTLTGPSGSKALTPNSKGYYASGKIGGGQSGTPGFLDPGDFTISNGSGGADVGPFNVKFTIPKVINWTNITAPVPRSQDLAITWSGAGANDGVAILGITGVPSNGPLAPYLEFLCVERASAGQFNVPSLLLSLIPNTAQAFGIPGLFLGVSDVSFTSFTAPGLDLGSILTLNFVATLSAVQ